MVTKPWSEADFSELKKINGVCLDIDDTLSTSGKLTPEAYASLWRLKESGLRVVPITGRPAGWCDHIARFWPVDAVVGENGAFTFWMDGRVRRRLETPGAIQDEEDRRSRLGKLAAQVRQRFPQAVWASDQPYREHDLAIDICEDVPRWTDSEVKQLLDLCHDTGAHAKLSSIHVNAWFGDYDKRAGFQNLLSNTFTSGSKPWPSMGEWLFIGDSPNDEPLFETFRASVGVANVRNYIAQMKSPPRWVTDRESGAGFVEMVDHLLRARHH